MDIMELHHHPFSFFKLILTPSTQFSKLRLPETFGSTVGDEISETCQLTVPTGETHRVALVNEDNKLWFSDGWERFVDRFSIGYGYFIVFTYNGNSDFNVKLFDTTACEIPYNNNTSSIVEYGSNRGDLDPEFLEELSDGNEHERVNLVADDLHLPSVNHQKQSAVEEGIDMDGEDNEVPLSVELSETITIADAGRENDNGSQSVKLECMHSKFPDHDIRASSWQEFLAPGSKLPVWLMTYKKELKGAAAAGLPVPSRPFFVARIKSAALHWGRIPIFREFARYHIRRCAVKLKMSEEDGKQWPVRCYKSRFNCSFGRGWTEFARHAGLEFGDVCLFELTDAYNTVFTVHVVKSILG